MVLGIDWQTLDMMTLNFKDQRVRVTKEGKTWEFTEIQSSAMEVVFGYTHGQNHVQVGQRMGNLCM